MNWTGQHVLVTGAGGFVGSHLAEALVERGARVRAMVHYNALGSAGWLDASTQRDRIELVAGDVRDRDDLRRVMSDVEVVFHLAALIAIPYSYQAPESYVRTNALGTLNVLQLARELGTRRIVHTSTSETYGSARRVPIDEQHPLQAQSPYAASKIAADKIAESFALSFDVPVATVRPFNTYGPRQSARAVIPTIITQALLGREIRLGSLEPRRDFSYVADTVEGFILAAEAPGAIGEVYNIGSGRDVSIGEAARLVLELTARELPIVADPQRVRPEASEVDRLCADAGKAQRELGWSPKVDLADGLKRTIDWIEQNLDRYRPDIYAT